jgi:hypothetical protein
MGFTPANCFQPPKTILETFRAMGDKMQDFEYFREKAWQASHVLLSYMSDVKYR